MKLTKKDIYNGLMTGFITGFIAWRIMEFLDKHPAGVQSFWWLVLVVPVCWVAGVWFGYFLGRWMPFFNQFGKFAAIGFTNFSVDTGVLYLMVGLTGIVSGSAIAFFKVFSFIVAMGNSYFWNKYWAFSASQSHGGSGEVAKFIFVNVGAMIVNAGILSVLVNVVGPMFGIDAKTWIGASSVAGSAIALVLSFIGFRVVVFNKKQ